MKKKIMSLCLVAVLAVTAIAGATLAYFTDEDSAKNVFTTGGVDIEIVEKKYENGGWAELEANENGITELGKLEPGVEVPFNKCVFTYNNEDEAYIRNYYIIEQLGPTDDGVVGIHANYNDADYEYEGGVIRHGVTTTKLNNVKIGERYFDVYVCETIGHSSVKNGESVLSLTAIWLDKAFNNELADAFGDLEVYTASEAIQKAGLTYEQAMAEMTGEGSLEDHVAELFKDIVPSENK